MSEHEFNGRCIAVVSNEYSDTAYSIAVLWSEIRHKRQIISEAQTTIDALGDFVPGAEVQSSTGRLIPASVLFGIAQEQMLEANDIAMIEREIWRRSNGIDPDSDPELFSIMFGKVR